MIETSGEPVFIYLPVQNPQDFAQSSFMDLATLGLSQLPQAAKEGQSGETVRRSLQVVSVKQKCQDSFKSIKRKRANLSISLILFYYLSHINVLYMMLDIHT